jgi:hypothetical protein
VYKDDVFKIKQLFRYGSLSGLKDVTILSWKKIIFTFLWTWNQYFSFKIP